ncbi:hypothetical protein CDD81_1465 [Ophiocordyceps australis]|uniref:NodB homology domain-containing protein n=1 Tax=Ophiocordyceps australis TaxID=1399860 RepID=A0A2C5XKI4_9HYPO|nr:hypothetical protein CDD81_1465 [Ophiocordyceps australis]
MLPVLVLGALLQGTLASPVALSASKFARQASPVPFGQVIDSCTVPGGFALTFDDGPWIYTNELLDKLRQANLKATFFVNGQNIGNIDDRQPELQRMVNEGHQIGSHTFRHADLTTLGDDQVRAEMTQLDDKLRQLVGRTPTYMRPPYFATNANVLRILSEMQYHVIDADIDTLDYQYATPETNYQALDRFKSLFGGGGSISLMHDWHVTTVQQLVPNVIAFLQEQQNNGRISMTVGECLGDASQNWYR